MLSGLRKTISLIYTSKARDNPAFSQTNNSNDPQSLFSAVIKNIASPNLEIKKLVYVYLLHYAENEPDTALLGINTIQKSLSDQNPHVRALALRVMSGIRVPVISQIVGLGIKRGCSDMSPYVRRAAALAIPKCYNLDPATLPQLLDYLGILLGDKQYFVAGAAVMAFNRVCPERIDLVHRHYRGLVRKLVDMDEWSQLATLRMLTVYARRCLPQRTKRVKRKEQGKGFYDDEVTHDATEEADGEEIIILDPDLELLLQSAKPLLQSRSSAVIIAVARLYLYLSPPNDITYLSQAVGPMISLLRSPLDVRLPGLHYIIQIALHSPPQFVPYLAHFLIRETDPPQLRVLKLELLTIIFPHCSAANKSLILAELSTFARSHDICLVREAVRAIGRCAQNSDAITARRCLRLLLQQISSADGNLVAESLTVVRHLIQRDPSAHWHTVIRLAKNLDTTTNPYARASIIWLVGEFASVDPRKNIAADVLRILARDFAEESEVAKSQIVLLAAKVYVHWLNAQAEERERDGASELPRAEPLEPASTVLKTPVDDRGGSGNEEEFEPDRRQMQEDDQATTREKPHPIPTLWNYILLLARYDTSYDLRDRTRLYKALLVVPSSTQLANLLLLAPKPIPQTLSPSESRKSFTLGSASLVVGGDESGLRGLRGYEPLPQWVKEGEEPDPRLREEVGATATVGKKDKTAGDLLDRALTKEMMGKSTTNNGTMPGTAVKEKTLSDWLDEEKSDRESEETEEESEEVTTEGETTEEEESGSDESEEKQGLIR